MNNDRTNQTTKTNERDGQSGKQSQDDTRHAGTGGMNPSKTAGTPKQDDDSKRMGGSTSDHGKQGRPESK